MSAVPIVLPNEDREEFELWWAANGQMLWPNDRAEAPMKVFLHDYAMVLWSELRGPTTDALDVLLDVRTAIDGAILALNPPGQITGVLVTADRKCRLCGCTEDRACVVAGEPCHWVEPDLCSACAAAKEIGL